MSILTNSCPACANEKLSPLNCDLSSAAGSLQKSFQICQGCGFVSLGEASPGSPPNRMLCARLGTVTSPGRDFHMALMGATIHKRYELKVALHRPGVTLDADRILNIPMVSELFSIGEGGDHSLPDLADEKQGADLLILNETLQSMEDPNELKELLGSVSDEGLVIASTDLNDGSDLSESKFFLSNVTRSMWAGRALVDAAKESGFFTDFRLPRIALTKRLIRKRYIFFYKSDEVERSIRHYFSKATHAPSEA